LILPKVWIEPGIQPDALEPENGVDSHKASPSEPNLDVDGKGDGEIISMGDLDVIGPQVVSGEDSVNSGVRGFLLILYFFIWLPIF
jgi:hypothetical protein